MKPNDTLSLDADTSCSIAPGWGCNLFSWRSGGEELMFCPPDYPQAAWKITGGGNPILFPAVGRTWDTSGPEPVQGAWRLAGDPRAYHMPSHGIVFLSHFEKVEEAHAADSVSALYGLSVPDSVLAENYPFRMGLTQRFTLGWGKIDLEATATNHDTRPAPFAFGYHPYFRLSNPRREGVEVILPVRKRLGLTEDTVLLTGEDEDTDGVLHLEPDVYYDHAFGEPCGRRMSLIDRHAGRAIHVDFDEHFELFFVYAPDGSDFLCIEPWTRGLGAFSRLGTPGWESGEAIPVLAPGLSRTFRASFVVETLEGTA